MTKATDVEWHGVAGAKDIVGSKGGSERGAIGIEGSASHVGEKIGGVNAVLGGQARHEEGRCRRFDIVGQTDEGAAQTCCSVSTDCFDSDRRRVLWTYLPNEMRSR